MLGRVVLWDGVGQSWFDAKALADHLSVWLPWLSVELRGDLLAIADATLPEALAQTRVTAPTTPAGERQRRVLGPEADYEARMLSGAARATGGVIYDGVELLALAAERLPAGERGIGVLHVWLTERLFATWDDDDRRYHLRVVLCGVPTLLSTTGMVRAPARERSYYLGRRLGIRHQEATADFLAPEDPRTAAVAKGYAMQAVFYGLTGEPFCEEPTCRLFNAHWQQEMLAAQLSDTDYCPHHEHILEAWTAECVTTQRGSV